MKKSKLNGNSIIIICLFLLAFSVSAILIFYNKKVAAAGLAVLLILAVLFILFRQKIKKNYINAISQAAFSMSGSDAYSLEDAAFPVMVSQKSGEIAWCNKAFKNTVSNPEKLIGKNLEQIFDSATYDKITRFGSAETVLGDKIFKVFSVEGRANVLYFVDQTELKKTAAEYRFSRPVVATLEIDSLEEILKDANGSRRAQVTGDIEGIIENWFSCTGGLIRKISDSRFLFVFEERYLKRFEEEKFDILEKIRNYEFENSQNLTISIGAGYGSKSLSECEILSRQLLEMALSRGGDQAAVKSPATDYRFYGGVKAAGEKGSRVRSRITANSLKKLINGSSYVVVMGHKFSDLDSLGSALGIAAMVNSLGVEVGIAVNPETSMAKQLIRFCENSGLSDLFKSEREILSRIDENALLILTDTHRNSFVEFQSVADAISKKAVIDHHRKATDYIDDALIFYDEPVASSASETVTEFWQYIGAGNIGKIYANALLSGMMLDTKNFVIGTGVRTYEAAAYLRKCGADPLTVKKLFADSLETAKAKNEVVATTEIYRECALAKNPVKNTNARLISAQAADEMLSIEGVKASFVIFEGENNISISARSYGEINVQIIMEKLGGGGHRTMSACALSGIDIITAERMLRAKIDEYFKER